MKIPIHLHIYKALLLLLPRAFRSRYGAQMEESFDEMWRERRWGGRLWAGSNVSFWTQAVADMLASAANERFPTRPEGKRRRTSLPRTRNLMESTTADIRMAFRSIRRGPGVAAVAVIMLGLGVGANVSIFSLTDLVALRPLPYPEADRLLSMFGTLEESGATYQLMSTPDLLDIRERSQSTDVAARSDSSFTLTGGDLPERVEGDRVTSNFFDVLGVEMALGRSFRREEEQGGAEVAVITDGLWRRAFGADPGILGQTIILSSEPHTIVGVLPRGFWYVNNLNEVYVSLEAPEPEQRADRYQEGVGRIRPGYGIQQASLELDEIAAGLAAEYPETNRGFGVGALPFADRVYPEQLRQGGMVALAAVFLVLLIACANVANLMLARASGRGHEIAIRSALGASRGRIVRQLLVEAMVISVLGAALGVVLSLYGIAGLASLLPDMFPRIDQLAINGRALVFVLALTAFTGLLFGILPSLQSSRQGIRGALQESARGGSVRPSVGRLRRVLVVAQVALALVVVLACTLLVQGFFNLQAIDLGYDASHLLTFRLSLPTETYSEDTDVAGFWEGLLPRLAAVPGVELAAGSWFLPFMADPQDSYEVSGEVYAEPQQRPRASVRMVFPDYFQTMRIPLMRGRTFDTSDGLGQRCTLIVNEAFVARHWPGGDPLGNEVIFSRDPCEVIGVVGNTVENSREHRPLVYFSGLQVLSESMYFTLRTSGPPNAVVADVRRTVAGLDPDLAIYRVRSMREVVTRALSSLTIVAKVMPAVAVLALSLALIGVYALMAYSVSRRAHEVGVRMALGARPRDVLRLVIRQGTGLAIVGILIGLVLAPLLTRSLGTFLFDVSPFDWRAFTLVPVALLMAALAAAYIPARRATRVDPLVALRSE